MYEEQIVKWVMDYVFENPGKFDPAVFGYVGVLPNDEILTLDVRDDPLGKRWSFSVGIDGPGIRNIARSGRAQQMFNRLRHEMEERKRRGDQGRLDEIAKRLGISS